MQRPHRLLMVGVDHQALEVLPDGVDVTMLMGAAAKDIGLPLPREVRTIFVDDSSRVDAAVSALYRNGLVEFDAVYAHDELAMMTAAAIGSVLSARAIPAPVVARFRDKFLQKRVLREAGVPVTRSELIDDIRDLPTGYRLGFERAVVKPVAGQATASTFVARSTADVERISRDCRARSIPARTFVVEEFVEGEEWFADGVMSGGSLRFVSLGRYPKNCLTAVTEHSPVRTFCLDPVSDKACYDAALPVVEKALAVLGLSDGVFHMELFYRDGDVIFSECAARRAGGPIRDQVRYKFGVDLGYYSAMALLSSIEDIGPAVVEGVVASAFLPLVEGTLLDHPSVEELLAQPDVVSARIFVPRGLRTAGGTTNTFGRMGEFTVHASSLLDASRRLDEVSAWFSSRLKVIPYTTSMRELRALEIGL